MGWPTFLVCLKLERLSRHRISIFKTMKVTGKQGWISYSIYIIINTIRKVAAKVRESSTRRWWKRVTGYGAFTETLSWWVRSAVWSWGLKQNQKYWGMIIQMKREWVKIRHEPRVPQMSASVQAVKDSVKHFHINTSLLLFLLSFCPFLWTCFQPAWRFNLNVLTWQRKIAR